MLCRPDRTDGPVGGFVERSYLYLGNPGSQRVRVETNAPPGVSGVAWTENQFDGLGRAYRTARRGPNQGDDILVDTVFNARGGVDSTTEPFYSGETPRETAYPTTRSRPGPTRRTQALSTGS